MPSGKFFFLVYATLKLIFAREIYAGEPAKEMEVLESVATPMGLDQQYPIYAGVNQPGVMMEPEDQGDMKKKKSKKFNLISSLKKFKPNFLKKKGSYDLKNSYNDVDDDETVATESDKKLSKFNPFAKLAGFKPFKKSKKSIKKVERISENSPDNGDEQQQNTKGVKAFFKKKFKVPNTFKKFTSKAKKFPKKLNISRVKMIPSKIKHRFQNWPKQMKKNTLEPLTDDFSAQMNQFKAKIKGFTPFQRLLKKFKVVISPQNQDETSENAENVVESLEKEEQWKIILLKELEKMSYSDLRKLEPHKNWLFNDFVTYKETNTDNSNCQDDATFLKSVGELRNHLPDILSNELVERLCGNSNDDQNPPSI